ncbi:MAG: UDP-N-acetylmuramoyl-tripeptide--D-alanyl-D-alanine ligase [Flavobacteriaceae bacterium]|jgi:UDP-N-acetylmuramoyl-tripeptide--D-alanyl-D-alanine ligase|nr:UDP-N-acetylmuramoyl-tripeptide--D-alanyl-D-alanine ligase [Flavobacteriaceae bacterium]
MNLTQLHDYYKETSGVVTDSRKLIQNCFFIALRGENFDGNQFAETAIAQGAKYALVDRPEIAEKSDRLLLVDNTLESLQELAQYHRNKLKAKIIALTGSNGKTTTKELIMSVLGKKFDTKATKGNLNNHIGVPLTLLDFDQNTEIGIVEMGANHQKEIDFLCQLAQPDIGLITNFGEAHLEGFGGVEGVIKGKSELYKYLSQIKGTIILNIDDSIQSKWESYSPHYTFGEDAKAYCRLEYLKRKSQPLAISTEGKTIESQLFGEYNYSNIAVAVALGKFFDLNLEQIEEGISGYRPTNNRSQIIHKGTNKITLDAYNANPSSMKASITSFVNNREKKGVVILGDMFELGTQTASAHQEILNLVVETNVEDILVVGKYFFKTQTQDPRVQYFSTLEEIKNFLIQNPFDKSDILIKGSRRMTLETLLEQL